MNIGRFTITSDKFQWILTEAYDGKDRKGNPKVQTRETYHATLEQCCMAIVQREAKLVDDVAGVINAITAAAERIAEACYRIKKGDVA